MKILIVEDEYYTRKAIVKMLKEWTGGTEVVHDVENGKHAIAYIEKEQPDVIITDIRMPEIDGLELCNFVKRNYPLIRIIILSGYSEFEYAQRAITFDVREYLLKPLDKELLFNILQKLSDEIKVSKVEKMNVESMRVSAAIADILSGSAEAHSFTEFLNISKEPLGFISVIFQMNPFKADVIKYATQYINGSRYFTFNNHNEIGVIILYYYRDYNELIVSDICKLKADIIALEKEFSCQISGGRSSFHEHINELPLAYKESKKALNYRLIQGWGNIFEYIVTKKTDMEGLDFDEEKSRIILSNLESGDKVSVRKFMNDVFKNITKFSIDEYQQLYIKIISIINDKFKELATENASCVDYIEKVTLSDFNSFEEVLQYLSEQTDWICDTYQNIKKKGNINVIEDLKKYVEDNYHLNIVLDDIAQKHYFINPSYLSKLFKSTTGENFSKYLIRVRMMKAKKLFEQGDMKVSDVANFVGYDSVSHFVQAYKKKYGVTPGEYKNNLNTTNNFREEYL